MGYWESDTVTGIARKSLFSDNSRYLVGGKAIVEKAYAVNEVMMQEWKGQLLYSITPDCGKEFSKHATVTATLDYAQLYFSVPYQPWATGHS